MSGGLAIVDRARVWKGARTVGRVVWAVVKSVAHFAFGILVLGFGAFVMWAVGGVLLSADAAILQEIAHGMAVLPASTPPTMEEERLFTLFGFGFGLLTVLAGFSCLNEWRKALLLPSHQQSGV